MRHFGVDSTVDIWANFAMFAVTGRSIHFFSDPDPTPPENTELSAKKIGSASP
jgi:hypothetical protein